MNQKEKLHCRCKACGYIRMYTRHLIKCPICGNKEEDLLVPSGTPKQEALKLLCEAFKIGPASWAGQKIKQALDIIMVGSA